MDSGVILGMGKSVQQISTTRIPSHTVIPTTTVRNGGAHLFDSVMYLVCHVLRSVIKKSEHYSLQGVIVVEEKDPILFSFQPLECWLRCL